MPNLFYDLSMSGHHVEYFYHLIKFRLDHPGCADFVLLTNPDFINFSKDWELPEDWRSKGVTIVYLPRDEMRQLLQLDSAFKRAAWEFRVLHKYVHVYKVKRCYLLSLNNFQFTLGSQMGRSLPCAIRGILFNPFGVYGKKEAAWFTKLRKHFQMLWMLRNRNLEHIFILNNDELTNDLNKKYGRKNLFVSLPDPILIPPKGFRHIGGVRIPERSNKCRFLLFGSLSARKGIFVVLEALRAISEDIISRIEVVFAGRVTAQDREAFLAELASVRVERPVLGIYYMDEFIPYDCIPELFSSSDCVLVPYVGDQASSGLLGHAALYKKLVIGPGRGLVGHLIRAYDLGLTVPIMDAEKLASAITDFFLNEKSYQKSEGMQRFVQERHPTRFVEALIA